MEDTAEDTTARFPESETNSELFCLFRDEKGHEPVETDGGEKERRGREAAEKRELKAALAR